MSKLGRNLVHSFKLKVLNACSKMVGKHYNKFLSIYNFCSWKTQIVNNSKEALFLDFTYENRDVLYTWVNEQVIANAPIDYLEFGVYQGETIKKWCSINKNQESRFFGFDSFEGLPESWDERAKGKFSTHGATPNVSDSRVIFIKGLFQDTLPDFLCSFKPYNQLVIHLDAGLYSSTLFSLIQLNKIITSGSILIFDQFSYINHEFSAFRDFIKVCGRKWLLIGGRKRLDKVVIKIL